MVCMVMAAPGARADEYVPPPPETVANYFPAPMPCRIVQEDRSRVVCKGDLLARKTLRELTILRNTIYARQGWGGYRKQWLKEYFQAQPWFKANPKFSYKLLSDADRKNAHFIGAQEQSYDSDQLRSMKEDIYARHGKIWDDVPEWTLDDKSKVKSCERPKSKAGANSNAGTNTANPKGDTRTDPADPLDLSMIGSLGRFSGDEISQSRDCRYREMKWYKPNKAYNDALLSADDKVELGLLARAMGSFALDDGARDKASESLDRILSVVELRQLSLRDLRLLRNSIYARRGRPFKSEVLRDHFSGMDWYKVDPAYTDKLLSKNDTRNISLIHSVENEFGGALSDEDWLTEPAVDGA